MAEIRLKDLIDVAVLQELQDGFSRYTNMAALTTEADGTPVTNGSGFTDFCTNLTRKSELGCKRCEECDKNGALKTLQEGKPSVYNCHAGLVDFAAPIMVEGRFIGSIIGGQVRTEPVDEEDMKKRAIEMGIDPVVYIEAAQKTPMLEREEIERAAEFLSIIAKVLSQMAYRNYSALQQSRKMEKAARSQSAFIMSQSSNMQGAIKDWLSATKGAVDSGDPAVLQNTVKELLPQYEETYFAVEDAVEYIRMAGDEVEILETEYNIRSLLKQIGERMVNHTGRKGVSINVKISPEVPEYLLGDSGRIGQIVSKLLQYMLVYMENGSILMDVSCYKMSYATMLEILFKDEQREMSSEKIREIRKYFSQENIHGMDAGDTMGLSSSFVNLLVEQLSGMIKVENGESDGIIFKITLPQLEIRE